MTDQQVADILSRMFKGVTKPWQAILLTYKPELIGIIRTLINEPVTPSWDNVLNFARFPYKDIIAVIVGQDPYPGAGQAHGLSFSSEEKNTIPSSLSRIYGAMVESKVLPTSPTTANLTPWAYQGILMMNATWTTRPGISNAHVEIWSSYTTKIFKYIYEHPPNPLTWLLWGKFAQERCSFVDEKSRLTHCHPVAATSPSFKYCNHFRVLADKYPHIIWDLKPVKSTWYTDGSCPNNGKAKAKGAWGVVCTAGQLENKEYGGPLPALEPVDFDDGKITQVQTPPSNIRAEGYALINAYTQILDTKLCGEHIVKTDSKFWIDMVENWIPGWLAKGTKFESKKNSDLTKKFWDLYRRGTRFGIKLQWVKAYHEYDADKDTQLDWEGNRRAENIAKANLPD